METLFNEDEIFVSERPDKLTDSQRDKFYMEMAKEVVKGGWSDDCEETIAEDLSELSFRDNGFEMAKVLESYGGKASYNIDTDFCEWLDCLSSEYDDRLEVDVKAWVKAHDVKPQFEKGTKLTVLTDFSRSFKTGETIYVIRIYTDKALYVVHPQSDYKGGTLIPFEKIEKCCTLSILND